MSKPKGKKKKWRLMVYLVDGTFIYMNRKDLKRKMPSEWRDNGRVFIFRLRGGDEAHIPREKITLVQWEKL